MDDTNNGTHNDNDIIMDNEDDPDSYSIHDNDDENYQLYPQLETTNEQLHPAPLPEPTVEAGNIYHSTRVHTNPQRLIPPIYGRKSYDITAATTILEQEYVDLVDTGDHLDSNYTLVAHYVIKQISMKEGLKIFKERGETSVTTELSQLYFHDTFEPVEHEKLNHR